MQCPRCQQDNPSQARFCMKCGSSMTVALTTLKVHPPSVMRDDAELNVRISLVAPLVAAGGFGSEPVASNAVRALELSDRLGDDDRRSIALYARWVNLRVRGQCHEAFSFLNSVGTAIESGPPEH